MLDSIRQKAYSVAKRGLDIAGSAAGLAVTSPIWVSAAAAIGATMGRPIFFVQPRAGRESEVFDLIKFRTMREPEPGEERIGSDANRITAVGEFLRSTSIDELPTLINVLKGDMSLVGPRPLLVRYLDRYDEEQARRHDVKPGVTGWAQINGRNAISWDEKFEYDVWYVDNRSIWLDIYILLKTVEKVLLREGINADEEEPMPEFMG